jgi:Short repeat of unknown function (DUF308)
MFTVTGLLSIAFGAIVVDRPVAGALTIALLFGLFSIGSGVTAILQGDQLRRTRERAAFGSADGRLNITGLAAGAAVMAAAAATD